MKKRYLIVLLPVVALAVAVLAGGRSADQDHVPASTSQSPPSAAAPAAESSARSQAVPQRKTAPPSSSNPVAAEPELVTTEEAYYALPEAEREYTPTSPAMAYWMNLHRFPTAVVVAEADEAELRRKAFDGPDCDMRAANALIAVLRQRGNPEWLDLASQYSYSDGSLYATRALLNEELRKPKEERNGQRMVFLAATASALGANNLYGMFASSRASEPRLYFGSALEVAIAIDSANEAIREAENRHKHRKNPSRFIHCSVVRAPEPPHPWYPVYERFLKLYPEYPR